MTSNPLVVSNSSTAVASYNSTSLTSVTTTTGANATSGVSSSSTAAAQALMLQQQLTPSSDYLALSTQVKSTKLPVALSGPLSSAVSSSIPATTFGCDLNGNPAVCGIFNGALPHAVIASGSTGAGNGALGSRADGKFALLVETDVGTIKLMEVETNGFKNSTKSKVLSNTGSAPSVGGSRGAFSNDAGLNQNKTLKIVDINTGLTITDINTGSNKAVVSTSVADPKNGNTFAVFNPRTADASGKQSRLFFVKADGTQADLTNAGIQKAISSQVIATADGSVVQFGLVQSGSGYAIKAQMFNGTTGEKIGTVRDIATVASKVDFRVGVTQANSTASQKVGVAYFDNGKLMFAVSNANSMQKEPVAIMAKSSTDLVEIANGLDKFNVAGNGNTLSINAINQDSIQTSVIGPKSAPEWVMRLAQGEKSNVLPADGTREFQLLDKEGDQQILSFTASVNGTDVTADWVSINQTDFTVRLTRKSPGDVVINGTATDAYGKVASFQMFMFEDSSSSSSSSSTGRDKPISSTGVKPIPVVSSSSGSANWTEITCDELIVMYPNNTSLFANLTAQGCTFCIDKNTGNIVALPCSSTGVDGSSTGIDGSTGSAPQPLSDGSSKSASQKAFEKFKAGWDNGGDKATYVIAAIGGVIIALAADHFGPHRREAELADALADRNSVGAKGWLNFWKFKPDAARRNDSWAMKTIFRCFRDKAPVVNVQGQQPGVQLSNQPSGDQQGQQGQQLNDASAPGAQQGQQLNSAPSSGSQQGQQLNAAPAPGAQQNQQLALSNIHGVLQPLDAHQD